MQFPHLEEVAFDGGRLVNLPGDLFKYTPNIKRMNFASNLLVTIGEDLLSGLVQFQFAYFSSNICISSNGENKYAFNQLFAAKCARSYIQKVSDIGDYLDHQISVPALTQPKLLENQQRTQRR